MAEISWFDAFAESMNVIFTEDDFKIYLADVENNINLYRKYLAYNSKILDLGCGLGVTSVPLSTLGFKITGIDNDERVVEAAKTNAKNFGKDIRIIIGDIFNINKLFEPDSFDACDSGGLLEHFTEAEIKELLNKQLIVAPLIIASMPVASFSGEVWDDGIYRNLWDTEYWLNNIFKDFNIVESNEKRASEAIGGFLELEVVIKR